MVSIFIPCLQHITFQTHSPTSSVQLLGLRTVTNLPHIQSSIAHLKIHAGLNFEILWKKICLKRQISVTPTLWLCREIRDVEGDIPRVSLG
jgi:hypothetical protein